MNNAELKQAYRSIRHYASVIGNVSEEARLLEVCDFDDSYGFLLDTGDKFANLYWCIKKNTYELYSYRPNMNMNKFTSRKILPNNIVE